MNHRRKYRILTITNSLVLMFSLIAILIGGPYAMAKQLADTFSHQKSAALPFSHTDEEAQNPLNNTNEEKASGSNNLVEEYLHESNESHAVQTRLLFKFGNQDTRLYSAFHGELLVPPPNAVI